MLLCEVVTLHVVSRELLLLQVLAHELLLVLRLRGRVHLGHGHGTAGAGLPGHAVRLLVRETGGNVALALARPVLGRAAVVVSVRLLHFSQKFCICDLKVATRLAQMAPLSSSRPGAWRRGIGRGRGRETGSVDVLRLLPGCCGTPRAGARCLAARAQTDPGALARCW